MEMSAIVYMMVIYSFFANDPEILRLMKFIAFQLLGVFFSLRKLYGSPVKLYTSEVVKSLKYYYSVYSG